ncbi:MAG TPA: cellulose synthase subunit BcsC-related outer membrane protein, partial [Gallionella sp.]|nr:cellulose synthase subunit BcsC-related outer membrane protein [Gallionella sp.]
PVTGAVWGGVTNTGVSLYMSTSLRDFKASVVAAYGLLRGKNVLNNDRVYLRAAVDRDVYTDGDTVLNVGVNANYTSFSKNESFYTFGHGGYYSPQSSLSFGVPVELSGRADLLSYQLRAGVSYSRTKEDAALYYPTDPALQAMTPGSTYAGGNGGGFGYNLRAVAEYRVAPDLALGGRFSIERSAYYAPNSVLFYLRYLFTPETGPVKLTPDPVVPYSQY